MSSKKESVSQMLGQALREMGILVLTFLPLDYLFASERLSGDVYVLGALCGAVVLTIGIWIERFRSE